MATGFIYIVTSLNRNYMQEARCNVPTDWTNPLYFGPCKIPIRKKMKSGDFVFGISPSGINPRRIVFIAQIKERITFAEAYNRLPDLRGPIGPIHVKPINGGGEFPHNSYEHIQGAMHPRRWVADLRTLDLDAFFICHKCEDWLGKWLGANGPTIDSQILKFLKTCSVHGFARSLNNHNPNATVNNPVCHGKLYRGLHLETIEPEELLKLCGARIAPGFITPEKANSSSSSVADGNYMKSSHRKGCC